MTSDAFERTECWLSGYASPGVGQGGAVGVRGRRDGDGGGGGGALLLGRHILLGLQHGLLHLRERVRERNRRGLERKQRERVREREEW